MKIKTLNLGLAVMVMLANSLAADSLEIQRQTVVTPSPDDLNGNSAIRPFNEPQAGRFQQLYDASLFHSLPTGGGSIDFIFFRIDPFGGQTFSALIPNIQINLSTTSRTPDGLSSVFDENTGADDAVALGPASVNIFGAGGGGLTGFNVFFTLNQPFHYDPALGNLLVDFRIPVGAAASPGRIGTLDAFDVIGDGVSSVYASNGSLGPVGQVSTLGLATAFRITPVPEPSALVLVAVGGLAVLALARARQQKG